MNSLDAAVAIAIMAIVTLFLRGIPFVAFRKRKVPAYIEYLGKYLPYAVMAMLVVYCLKGVDVLTGSHGIPEFIAVLVVAVLHIWKKNTVLSVIVGTACYMIILRLF